MGAIDLNWNSKILEYQSKGMVQTEAVIDKPSNLKKKKKSEKA